MFFVGAGLGFTVGVGLMLLVFIPMIRDEKLRVELELTNKHNSSLEYIEGYIINKQVTQNEILNYITTWEWEV